MTRFKFTIEYRGTGYAGWQRQPDCPSIQQAVEDAVRGFSKQVVHVQCAGRTDAGVHALGQVAHMDLNEDAFSKTMDEYAILKAVNAHLREDTISITKVERVHDDFQARFDATNKLYRYRLLNRQAVPAIEDGLVWHEGRPLDVDAMRYGAKHLLGHHDFTTFRDSECQAKSPMKTLDRLDIYEKDYDDVGGKEIVFETEGQSFLHHQVRNMVGTLVQVGLGKWQPDDVKTALEAKDRKAGGQTAPSDGLYLVRIDYD
ncbi:MAG: tRNA pseudouridine(38-40) synthase TruA [Alphaproteobacteria bacterium]|nr:tRNA pseudouridine(38-40) synthase TruA [Alphaproteobacteria bacterium]